MRTKNRGPSHCAEDTMVMALVVCCGASIAEDDEHERVKLIAKQLLRFMENMGFEIKPKKRKPAESQGDEMEKV